MYKYNFYEDGITQSMIASFLECPRQAAIQYIEGWIPKGSSPYLELGNCVHYILEKAYQLSSQMEALASLEYWIATLHKQLLTNDIGSDQIADRLYLLAKTDAICRAYFIIYRKDWEEDYHKNLLTESKFKFPYEMTFLNGKMDLFLPSVSRFIDHKCRSNPNIDEEMKILDGDLQLNFYNYITYKLTGKPAKAKLNIIKNTAKKPLKRQKETLPQFAKRLKEEMLAEYKEYFWRITLNFTEKETIEWEKTILKPIIFDMLNWFKCSSNSKWYNPIALKNRYNFKASAFADCILRKDYTGMKQKEVPFVELI